MPRSSRTGFRTVSFPHWARGATRLPSAILTPSADPRTRFRGPTFTYRGATLIYTTPITEIYGDIVISASSQVSLVAGNQLPVNCTGIRFINLLGTVVANFNQGGTRTVLDGDVYDGCEIRTLQINTAAVSSVTVQPIGTTI